MREQDLRRALEALERGLGGLRRCHARQADADFDALMLGLAAARGREAARLRQWLNGRLPELGADSAALSPTAAPTGSNGAAEQLPPTTAAPPSREPAVKGSRQSAQVLERRPISADLLTLRLSRPPGFDYRAGDYVKLTLAGVSRPYSLVSAPHEPELEFFIELHPGGRQAQLLRGIASGAPIGLGAAKAGPRLATTRRRHLMVATVTGIAPFVSLLRERLRAPAGEDEFHVLHGASYRDEFGYDGELAALAARPETRLRYRPAVSRPEEPRNAGWSGERGRVADQVEAYLAAQAMSAADTALYACGHPELVASVRRRFAPLGYVMQLEPY